MYRHLLAIIFLLACTQAVWAQKDFSLSISPPSQTINAGRQAVFTVTAQPINGFKKPVALSVIANPGSSDISVSLASTVISPGTSTTITVTTSPLANAQNVSLAVTGTAKNKTRNTQATLTVNVPGFSLSADPQSAIILQGDTMNFTIRSQGEQDFARDINLNVTATPSVPFQLSKSVLSPPNDTASVVIDTTSIPVGAYAVNIVGTAGQLQQNASFTFTVMAKPAGGKPDIQVQLSTVNLRADEIGHLVVTGIAQNVGSGDAAFVKITAKVFNTNNQLLETNTTFVNGFPGITSSGIFTETTLPRGKSASFQNMFNLTFVSNAQRVEFTVDFLADTIASPKANLVIDSLTRTINNRRGSDYSVVVRNIGTVAARAPQVVIDSFDRSNAVFDVTIAGKGDPNDVLPAGQSRIFTATSDLPFDNTRVNTQHAIWIDDGAMTVVEPLSELPPQERQKRRNELIEMELMAHQLLRMAN